MGRSIIATLASLFLLCAALLVAASPSHSLPALVVMINTDDGVSLDESVIDDLRPSALQDTASSSAPIDQLPASAWPAWDMAGRTATWGLSSTPRPLPWPYLGSPLRPPSAA